MLRGGVPSFAALAMRMHVRDPRRAQDLAAAAPATYLAFDVLRPGRRRRHRPHAGVDRPAGPARGPGRRAGPVGLAGLAGLRRPVTPSSRPPWRQGLEGVVAKRRSSRYHAGRAQRRLGQAAAQAGPVLLVGGWRRETGGRDRLGRAAGRGAGRRRRPAFAGRVGSVITARDRRRAAVAAHAVRAMPVHHRRARGRRRRHASGRRRGSWSTCATSAGARRAGCASPCSAASAPT